MATDQSNYPRNLIGYGQNPPDPKWPNQSKIALQFVINYEEGGENCILHGDKDSEAFLTETVGAQPHKGMRNTCSESVFEYGSRAGFWRLHRMFTNRNIPVTVYGVAMAMQRNPAAIKAMKEAGWEIASHGYRWIEYQYYDINEERKHMQKAIQIHTEVTGSRPLGWYTGCCSPNTEALVVEEGGFLYHSDSYSDDLPYWDTRFEKPQLVIPYTLDCNDWKFSRPQGFNSGDQFFSYLKDAFDVLYEEGEQQPKMMSVGLHCRLVGRPGRAASLARFMDYVLGKEKVWICTREQIARHWHKHHPLVCEKETLK